MTEDSPEHYAFVPGATTVPVGATVTWTDMSDAPHTVTSDSGAFGSGTLNPNQAFQFTFTKAGTYTYHCSIHSYMHGAITVTAAAPATAVPVHGPVRRAGPGPRPHAEHRGGRYGRRVERHRGSAARRRRPARGLATPAVGTSGARRGYGKRRASCP